MLLLLLMRAEKGERNQALLRWMADANLSGPRPVHGAHPAHARRAHQPPRPERGDLVG